MLPEIGQDLNHDSPISEELQRELDKIYERHYLSEKSQNLIRCLRPGDNVEVWHSAGLPSHSGTVVSNDGKSVVISCSLFDDGGKGSIEFDAETACSREFIDNSDGPFYFEFAIPKPFKPNFIDINSTHELAPANHAKGSIPDLVVLKEYIRQAFITLLKEELSYKGDKVLLKAYMKQLKKGDKIKFGLRNKTGELMNYSQNAYFKAFDGIVISNNTLKVEVDSEHYQNKKKKIGRRSFDIATGESSGPAFFGGDEHGLCFYFIEVPSDFLPDTFMKVVELGPENLTIVSETQRDSFMDDMPF